MPSKRVERVEKNLENECVEEQSYRGRKGRERTQGGSCGEWYKIIVAVNSFIFFGSCFI